MVLEDASVLPLRISCFRATVTIVELVVLPEICSRLNFEARCAYLGIEFRDDEARCSAIRRSGLDWSHEWLPALPALGKLKSLCQRKMIGPYAHTYVCKYMLGVLVIVHPDVCLKISMSIQSSIIVHFHLLESLSDGHNNGPFRPSCKSACFLVWMLNQCARMGQN